MSEIKEYVAHLSQTIGPRPAGTEEEQQAALYIAEALQNDAELTASIEDFNCNPDFGVVRAACGAVTALMAFLAILVLVMVVPALIVTLAAAALFAAESLGKPVVSRLLNRGVSQNVVAKYEPPASGSARRRRKIILVAHYDSGRVQKGLTAPVIKALPTIRWVELGAMALVPLLLLIRLATSATGGLSVFLTVLTVVALVVALLPLVSFVMNRVAPYNEGANCNAAGVSVLMEVAARVGRGRVSEEEIARQEAVMHGEEAALASGFVPADAVLDYEAPAPSADGLEESPEARLLAAKAAVAALSGLPVSNTVNIDLPDEPLQVRKAYLAAGAPDDNFEAPRGEAMAAYASDEALSGDSADHLAEADVPAVSDAAPGSSAAGDLPVADPTASTAAPAAAQAAYSAGVPADQDDSSPSVPAWFKVAQEKAKARKPVSSAPVHRSRYAEALDAAERERAQRAQQAEEAAPTEAERRLQSMRESILKAQASDFDQVSSFLDQSRGQDQARGSAAQPQAAVPYEGAPHQANGVGGFLSSVTASAGYASDADAGEPSSPAGPVEAASPADFEPQIGDVMVREASVEPLASPAQARQDRAALRAVPAVRVLDASLIEDLPSPADPADPAGLADSAGAASAAGGASSPAPSPDRTIAFIPVAVDGEALKRESREMMEAERDAQRAFESLGGSSAGQAAGPKNARRKRAISLPSLTGELEPVAEHKQHAPLADRSARAQSLRAAVPSLDGLGGSGDSAADKRAQKASLRASLPSLSGVIAAQNDVSPLVGANSEGEPSSNVSQAGSFASAGATGAFAPVGDELVEDVSPDEMYVDDADDSAYEESYTETGAFAGPGYVEMPKSRASRLLGKLGFGRKKDQEESSPQEWLDVDDSFEARAVGKARGGWESFREEQAAPSAFDDSYEYDEQEEYDEFDDYSADEDDYSRAGQRSPRWNGGAFSRESLTRALGRVKDKVATGNGADDEASAEEIPADAYAEDYAGYAGETGMAAPADVDDGLGLGFAPVDENVSESLEEVRAENVQRIYGFRHPDINTEVWFVALGADLAGNAGMSAFLTEHASELKGAVIVNLESLGSGKLTLVEQEGTYRPVKGSSRMKRFVRKASSALGMGVGSGSMLWRDSASACAARRGCQTMHLAGMEDGKPALYGEAHDVIDNVDEETMLRNADFIMEILKNI